MNINYLTIDDLNINLIYILFDISIGNSVKYSISNLVNELYNNKINEYIYI